MFVILRDSAIETAVCMGLVVVYVILPVSALAGLCVFVARAGG